MTPNGEALSSSAVQKKPCRLSMEGLQRTVSDISFELSKETAAAAAGESSKAGVMTTISEVEDAKCECCNMSEECTPEYIKRVSEKFVGKFICGLCAEAVQQEMDKNGGKREEALSEHMNACVKFNRYFRANPILCQAEAMREMLKKSSSLKGKSITPKQRKVGIARSSSCIAAITKENTNLRILN